MDFLVGTTKLHGEEGLGSTGDPPQSSVPGSSLSWSSFVYCIKL